MFRIHFSPVLGKFILEVHVGNFLFGSWVAVMGQDDQQKEGVALQFNTYREASAHADRIGLSTLYEDRSENKRRNFMRADREQRQQLQAA